MNYSLASLILRTIFTVIFWGIQYFLYRVARKEILTHDNRKNLLLYVRLLFIMMNLPILYITFAGHFHLPDWLFASFAYPFSIWQGATLFMFLVILIWKILASPYHAVKQITRFIQRKINLQTSPLTVGATSIDLTRRKLIKGAVAGLTVYSFGGATLGVLQHENFEVIRKNIQIENLPEKLKGLTIAVIADIHSGLFMSKNDMDEYVSVINQLLPDLILIPGDFVTNQTTEIFPVCDSFRKLNAPYGVYACLGNHDFFAEEDIICNELQRAGVRMLRDEHEILDIRDEKLAVIGVDDVRSMSPLSFRLKKACADLDPLLPNILLCHKPYYIEEAVPFDIDLILSGHTHGGQIVLADMFSVSITPASLISKYVKGHYALDDTQMYITRGIGTVGLPIRLNCPPEVTLITLV